MATNTTNFNLVKPDTTDFYDIADFNGNADIIDTTMKTNETNLTSHVGSGGTAHADATTSTDGFMTSTDKTKLDSITVSNLNQLNLAQTISAIKTHSANINLNDSIGIVFGNNLDFSIFHDGTNNIIRSTNHGALISLQGEDAGGTLRSILVSDPDGAVNLYYNGTSRLNTTSVGANVIGTLTATNATLDGNQVWHAGNDGTGSGLDADTLDGSELSSLVQKSVNGSITDFDAALTAGVYSFNNSTTNGPGTFFGICRIYVNSGEVHDNLTNTIWQFVYTTIGGTFFRHKAANSSWQPWVNIWTTNNDGSGSSLDADTLDGLSSTSFVRSDADDTVSGTLTFTTSPILADNVRLNFGTDNDAYITFDGTNMAIRSTGHGAFIALDAEDIGGTNRRLITADPDDGITLFHSANSRLQTNSTGIDVTGTVEADNMTINGNQVWHAGNDGASSGLDADTWQGFTPVSFLRSNVADDVTGQLTFTVAPKFNDNIAAAFGQDNDLQIFHDGTNSVVRSINHGALIAIQGEDAGGTLRNMLLSDPDASVNLHYNGISRLNTTSTGASVTGTLNATTDVQVNGVSVAYISQQGQNNFTGTLTANNTLTLNIALDSSNYKDGFLTFSGTSNGGHVKFSTNALYAQSEAFGSTVSLFNYKDQVSQDLFTSQANVPESGMTTDNVQINGSNIEITISTDSQPITYNFNVGWSVWG